MSRRSVQPSARVLQRRREIGAHITAARLHADLTVDGLAAATGLSRETIVRIGTGATAANVDWLILIADAVGVPLADLMREAPERHG